MPEEQEKYETRKFRINFPPSCPLSQSMCKRKDCAWWVTLWAGTEHEYSECAIASLARLNDISLMR
jgi:hypothetical protein